MPIEASLRDRLLKVLRLAEQGVGGERANAQVLLEKLLARHGFTLEDLKDWGEPREQRFFDVADHDEVALLRQLIDALLGGDRKCYGLVGPRLAVGCDATPSEQVAIEVGWQVYVEAWKSAKADLRVAFISRHQLFDVRRNLAESQQLAASSITQEELARRERVIAMMQGLEHVERPGRRLASGGG